MQNNPLDNPLDPADEIFLAAQLFRRGVPIGHIAAVCRTTPQRIEARLKFAGLTNHVLAAMRSGDVRIGGADEDKADARTG